MRLPKYITSEYHLMLGILLPYSMLINFIAFSKSYFTQWNLFFLATAITLSVKVIAWQLHTLIAMILARKFPKDGETMKRIGISLLLFFPLTALVNTFILWLYHFTGFFGFEFHLKNYVLVLISGVGLNVLATFLHEGVSNFEKWKATLTETEQLQKEYAKSQLDGLKSQVNPHFLFNSINTLSSLIPENPEKAEMFLDEMCKVYRYLLQNDKGEFVSLKMELQFIRSWFYILKIRYGQAIDFAIDVTDSSLEKRIPPLTLQLLIEHVLSQNMISKVKPLQIQIVTNEQNWLELYHTVAGKINRDELTREKSMENVMNKFRLLELAPLKITSQEGFQLIQIPLIE